MQTYITYSASDIGCVRKENQDTIGVMYNMHPSCSALLAVVCDGVGGLTAGKYASDTTYRKFVEWFQYEFVQIVHLCFENAPKSFHRTVIDTFSDS